MTGEDNMIRTAPSRSRRWPDERRADDVRAAHGTGPLRRPRPAAD
ncbi:MAG: hypothetical protein U0V56_06320 [Actinomycetota bacterium]